MHRRSCKDGEDTLRVGLYRRGHEHYWKTHAHPNSTSKYTMSSLLDLMSFDATDQIELIDSPLLMFVGSKADSPYISVQAFAKATGTRNIEPHSAPKYLDAAMAKLKELFARTFGR